MFLLSACDDIRMLFLNHALHHEVHLQILKATLEYPRLAQGALSSDSKCTLEAQLAKSMAAGCRHWLVHQLPADGTLEFLR